MAKSTAFPANIYLLKSAIETLETKEKKDVKYDQS